MTTSPPIPRLRHYLRNSWRVLLKEVSAFGFIGAIAFAIDLGVFAWLSPHGAIKANIVSTTLSTTFAYFGNRYLSFSHRARTSVGRETAFFFGINIITLVFSALCIAVFVYPLHYGHGSKTVFIVKVVTIGIGTIFRFWAYKRFVFLHPDRVHALDIDVDQELAE
ncbi:MAG TPA: GtrA family protein [Jatrophihabitantaceae bacterium]|jgi:putative flippase GtrA|nr:GtrA family protein [Jatrophihabitantaceae bacterium]